jgi:hypothetical protein
MVDSISVVRQMTAIALLGGLALLAVGCSQSTTVEENPPGNVVVTTTTRPLPAVVDGIPVLALAKQALGASKAWNVSHPQNVRVVITTQTQVWKVQGFNYSSQIAGSQIPAYFVALQGRFYCGGTCGASNPTGSMVSTTKPSKIPISSMVLEVPIPGGQQSASGLTVTSGLSVSGKNPDLTGLGTVHNLDVYVASLAGVSVRVGQHP